MSDPAPNPEPTTDPALDPAPEPKAEPALEPKASDPAPDPTLDPEPKEPTEADWRSTLPDDLKKHAERFNSVEDLVKANVDSRQKLSKAIVPPGKDAEPEEVEAYRKLIGVPAKAEGYKFEMLEGAEPTEADKAFQGAMAEAFHELNITNEQAKGLNAVWNEMTEAAQEAQAEADKKFAEESEATLRREWGADWDTNKTHAERAAAQMFGEEGLEDFRRLETKDGRFVADYPLLLRALASMGREMAEGGLVPPMSKDQAEQFEDELKGLREQIQKAKAEGDHEKADRLYQKELQMISKAKGSQPLVGSQGRAA